MQQYSWMKTFVFALCLLACLMPVQAQEVARGVVFHDANENGVFDEDEEGISGVRVSNGREVAVTDDEGRYEISVDDDTIVFVLKPRDWMTPVTGDQLPQFHYIHKPEGSPDFRFAGVEPTGPLPESIDFALVESEEPERFDAIFFGDTQARNLEEVEYIAHDVVADLIGTDAAFGVTLGDIVFDNLDMLEPLNGAIGQIGIPWYNIIGNHDINFCSADNALSTETFQRVYGPPYYAFEYGPVQFIVLNSVWWHGDRYTSRLGDDQLAFYRNVLDTLDREQLVVLLMHIPIMDTDERADVYELLSEFPSRLALAGHWHQLNHFFLDEENGWLDEEPLHVVLPGMVCGGWWSGHHDEYGIPHTTMYDGTPNGHAVFTFDGTDYSFEYIAARRPQNFQIAVYAPNAVTREKAAETVIMANVFAGSERNTVDMRLGETDDWTAMERIDAPDPNYARLKVEEEAIRATLGEHGISAPDMLGRAIPAPRNSSHLWRAMLPVAPATGTHTIHVRSTDMFGQVHEGRRIIRIK